MTEKTISIDFTEDEAKFLFIVLDRANHGDWLIKSREYAKLYYQILDKVAPDRYKSKGNAT